MKNIDIQNVKVRGKGVSYIRSGEGSELVFLLHGWPVTKESFSLVLPFLNENFQVIVPDFPGFGMSQELDEKHSYETLARSVIELMDELQIAKATISGMSMGAAVGLELARKYPERVKNLIINSPPVHHWDELTDSQKRLLKIVEKTAGFKIVLYECMKHALNIFSFLLFRENVDRKNVGFRFMVKSISRSGLRAPWEMLEEFIYTDLRPGLSEITVPTEVFVGLQDKNFLGPAKLVFESIPGAKIKYIEGDHGLVVKNPQLWADQLNYAGVT